MSTSTRLLVLGVVRIFQPVHGYDVRRELLSWRADLWANVAPGSIYNALKSLNRDGLLEVVGTDQVGGRPERTTYQLTGEGDKEFQTLLRDTWWHVRPPLDPLLPGLCFLPAMKREELLAALVHRTTQIEGMIRQHEFSAAQVPDAEDQTPAHVREMFRLSNARLAAEIGWARALAETLKRGEYLTEDRPGKGRPSGARAAGARRVPRPTRVARREKKA
jgi:DNA-binding PadR family transcriptional regulator